MGIEDEGKKLYDKAEGEVDGFFSRNKYTVVILTGVAAVIVWLVISKLF